MASQVITATELQVLEVNSYIRGYHVYVDIWAPTVGESLLVKPEPTNPNDKKAVAVLKGRYNCRSCTKKPCSKTLPVFKERRQQGICRGNRRESQQRSRLWPGSSVHLPFIRPSSLYRQDETTSR